MKISQFIFFSVTAFAGNPAYADMCDDFKAVVSVETQTTQLSVQAGAEIKLPVKIKIGETEAKRWRYIRLSTGLYNSIEGSKAVVESHSLKFGGGDLEIPSEFSFQTTSSMGGSYKVGVTVYAQDKEYLGACIAKFDPLPNLNIEISNKPEDVDINPPVLKALKFKKEFYVAGDTLEVIFQAEDKNEICTVWQEHNGVCQSGTHVELQAINGDAVIAFHTPTPIFKTKDKGIYIAVIPLSEEYATKEINPGIYRLVNFMFSDVHGNIYDKLPAELEFKVEFK